MITAQIVSLDYIATGKFNGSISRAVNVVCAAKFYR